MKFARAYVEITNICNMKCSFCHGTKRAPRRLGEEEFLHILDELHGVTEYIYLHVMGEPLTHPLLPLFIKMATERGFKCAITTNGTLLPTRAEFLLTSKPYKVNISLHSFEQGGASEATEYLHSCFNFADEASQSGILTVLRLWNRGYDEGRNVDILQMLRERFPDDEWAEGARGYRLRHKLHLEWGERFGWPDASGNELGDAVYCHGMGDHFGILSDGTVIPCCLDADGEIALGNIFERSIRDILTGERATAIREGFRNKRAVEQLCKKCPYARRFKV